MLSLLKIILTFQLLIVIAKYYPYLCARFGDVAKFVI